MSTSIPKALNSYCENHGMSKGLCLTLMEAYLSHR